MKTFCGLDIGGTKIGGAIFDEQGQILAESILPTPQDYESFLTACQSCITEMESQLPAAAEKPTVGIGVVGVINEAEGSISTCVNIPCLTNKKLRDDLSRRLNRPVRIANDANCMALAEAIDGAGRGYNSVFGLILGTGVGGGFVWQGKILNGANGLAGELGHTPLPFREENDPKPVQCNCKQKGCLDTTVSGRGLSHLYHHHTGQDATGKEIAEAARAGDETAKKVLDHFYDLLAKAMVIILHSFDPEVIVVSGGINDLPNLYEEVPKRWGRYALAPCLNTHLVRAEHGAMSGRRGAAWLWR